MKVFKCKNKRILTITLVTFFCNVFVNYTCSKLTKPDLIDLQKRIIVAKTQSDSLEILGQLDQYYLSISKTDSTRLLIESEVDKLIKDHVINENDLNAAAIDTNIYKLESQIKKDFRNALIASIRGEEQIEHASMQRVKTLAEIIDKRKNSQYWRTWFSKVANYDRVKARKWLAADIASVECSKNHLSDFAKAEKYGSYALNQLKQVHDERLYLDIMQRLITILYRFCGMYDLCYPLAQREIINADNIGYQLRAAGLSYHYANALFLAGKNHLALKQFSDNVNKAIKFCFVPFMDYYEKKGRLGTAKVNWQLGNYEKSLYICNQFEYLNLKISDRISLHNTRGVAYRSLGSYDKAKGEYISALKIAKQEKDVENQIVEHSNLGFLYYHLTEYAKAFCYYDTAMTLLTKNMAQNYELKSKVLMNLAEVLLQQNETDKFNTLVEETNALVELIDLPLVRANILRSLGNLNMTAQRYKQAYNQYTGALAIYEKSALLREGIDTKIDLVKNLIKLSEYNKAKKMLDDLLITTTDSHNEQGQVDAIGLLAQIAYLEGKTDFAIKKSNDLIKKIETLSTRFVDIDNLTFYRQKVYKYLKDAVKFELENGRTDSAFIKLDYMKARETKHILASKDRTAEVKPASYFLNLDKLKSKMNDKQLVVNYYVGPDYVYAFVLDNKELKLLKKSIKIENLRKKVNEFLNSINYTIDVAHGKSTYSFTTHYDSVMADNLRLSEILLDWPYLQERLLHAENTYIIPDDILYAVPFSCLIGSTDTDTSFLIQQTAVSQLPSAVFLHSERDKHKKQEHDHKKVLFCADRTFPGADGLVEFIKNRFPQADELTIDKTSIDKTDIMNKLAEHYDIYFFIGHSVANCQMPDLSYFDVIASRKSDAKKYNVPISLMDFKAVNWSHAKMIFLVGCETGIGKLYEGSGFSGFQQCLLSRGAKTVLASMWKIDANYSITQIKEFLKIMENSPNLSIALKNVKIKTINDLQNDYYLKKPHPYLWAGFTLSQTLNTY
jgi:CHAT domain-containing protein